MPLMVKTPKAHQYWDEEMLSPGLMPLMLERGASPAPLCIILYTIYYNAYTAIEYEHAYV